MRVCASSLKQIAIQLGAGVIDFRISGPRGGPLIVCGGHCSIKVGPRWGRLERRNVVLSRWEAAAACREAVGSDPPEADRTLIHRGFQQLFCVAGGTSEDS